jgi:hypothetical protein
MGTIRYLFQPIGAPPFFNERVFMYFARYPRVSFSPASLIFPSIPSVSLSQRRRPQGSIFPKIQLEGILVILVPEQIYDRLNQHQIGLGLLSIPGKGSACSVFVLLASLHAYEPLRSWRTCRSTFFVPQMLLEVVYMGACRSYICVQHAFPEG